MSSYEFTTERLTEERVIKWNIKNFTEYQETNKTDDTSGHKFCVGESLGQPSTWRLYLKFSMIGEMGLYLSLAKAYEPGKSVFAKYSALIKNQNSGKLIVSSVAGIKEYTTAHPSWGRKDFVTLIKLKSDGAINNDTLTIEVKIVVYGDEMVTTPASSQEMLKQNTLNQIAKHFTRLLKTGESSDFVIRVKKLDSQDYEERKVHRTILASQSSVFEAMLGTQMLEKAMGVVTIEDLSPKGLDVLLEFIYTGNIPDDWKLVPEEILNAAEKYDFPLLKNYIEEWLHTACTPENASTLFHLAKRTGLTKACNSILEYSKSNIENILSMI